MGGQEGRGQQHGVGVCRCIGPDDPEEGRAWVLLHNRARVGSNAWHTGHDAGNQPVRWVPCCCCTSSQELGLARADAITKQRTGMLLTTSLLLKNSAINQGHWGRAEGAQPTLSCQVDAALCCLCFEPLQLSIQRSSAADEHIDVLVRGRAQHDTQEACEAAHKEVILGGTAQWSGKHMCAAASGLLLGTPGGAHNLCKPWAIATDAHLDKPPIELGRFYSALLGGCQKRVRGGRVPFDTVGCDCVLCPRTHGHTVRVGCSSGPGCARLLTRSDDSRVSLRCVLPYPHRLEDVKHRHLRKLCGTCSAVATELTHTLVPHCCAARSTDSAQLASIDGPDSLQSLSQQSAAVEL